MKNRTLLPLLGVLLATSGLSGCDWYMRQANAIGSHMPTYDDWFGDDSDKKPTPPPQSQSYYGAPSTYNTADANASSGAMGNPNPNAMPHQPRYMPIPGNANQNPEPIAPGDMPRGYPYNYNNNQQPPMQPMQGGQPPYPPRQPQHNGYAPPPQQGNGSFLPPGDMPPAPPGGVAPPPPPGFPPPPRNDGGPDPAEGLKRLQMQQQMQPQQPGQPQGSYTPPAVPFTEPVLENPEPKMEPMAAVITEEQPEESGVTGFFNEVAREIGSWFGDNGDSPYPSLSSVPDAPGFKKTQANVSDTAKELEADRAAAQKEQKAAVSDWSQLAEDPQQQIPPAPVAEKLTPPAVSAEVESAKQAIESAPALPSAEAEAPAIEMPREMPKMPEAAIANVAPEAAAPAVSMPVSEAPMPSTTVVMAPPAPQQMPPEKEKQIEIAQPAPDAAPVMQAPQPPVQIAEPAPLEPAQPQSIVPQMNEPNASAATNPDYLRMPSAAPSVDLLPVNRYANRR